MTTMKYGWKELTICGLLTYLSIGTAHSGPPLNKPFKVCPEIVTEKDVPCRVIQIVAISSRMEIEKDPKDKEIAKLQSKIKELETVIKELNKTE